MSKEKKKITVETEIEFQRMIPHFHVSGKKKYRFFLLDHKKTAFWVCGNKHE